MSWAVSNKGFFVECYVLDNENSYNVSRYVEDVLVRKRFLEDSFPLYKINFRLTEELRDIIRDNDVSLYLRISMYKNDGDINIDEIDDSEMIEEEKIFDGYIRIYEKPYDTNATKVEEENNDASESVIQSAPFTSYSVSGIPEDLISKNESCVNNIFKNCELADALVYTISNIDKTSPMYIQETVNKTIEPDILIPPVSLIPAIQYLDRTYHRFYNGTANVFYDSNGFYMYDPLNCTLENSNYIECNVVSTDSTSGTERDSKIQIDTDGNIRINYRRLPAYTNDEKIAYHTLGSQTVYYYYDNNFYIDSREKKNNECYPKIRFLWEKLSDYSSEEFNTSKGISIILSNINPVLITPLTNLKIVSSEYKEAVGDYGIGEVIYGFMSSDKKHYTSSVQISGYKKK